MSYLLVNIVFRHMNGAGPCDNHAECAKKSRLFAPSNGGQTVAGLVLLYSAGDPTSDLCWLSQGRVWGPAVDHASPRLVEGLALWGFPDPGMRGATSDHHINHHKADRDDLTAAD